MDFTLPARSIPIQLVAGEGHYDTVIETVMAAKCSVWIATANLKDLMVRIPGLPGRRSYQSILSVFDGLADLGVELRILHASLPSRPFRQSFDRYPRLVAGGLELRLCSRVHVKTVIVDGRQLYVGSANWTGAGLGAKGPGRRNFELGVVTGDTGLLDQVQDYYDKIWRGTACGDCQRRDLCDAPLDI